MTTDQGSGASWFEERAGLAGTVAVLLGGAGAIGGASAVDLAANGVAVGVLDRDQSRLDDLRATLDRQGADALYRCDDAREPDALATLFAAVDDRWGRLDTLVNVVGGTFRADFVDTTPKGWDALVRTNFLYVLHACALAVPRMKAGGGGSIVNITTIEASRAAPGFSVYAGAKAAVEHFSRSLAVELAAEGIRVNNVAPDFVPTPGMADLGAESGGAGVDERAVRITIPMGRSGVPTDVSGSVVFLASALSSYVTGTTLHPDGGTYASSGWLHWPRDEWSTMVDGELLDHLPSSSRDAAT